VNYYSPVFLRAGDPADLRRDEEPARCRVPGVVEYRPDGLEQTTMGRLVDAGGLYEILLGVSKQAPGLPLFITENDRAAEDYVNPQGEVNDVERVRYLYAHLEAAARAIKDGASLAGYFVWSLLDNFEWAWGLPEAVRHRVRRLRQPAPHPQGQRALLRRCGADQRGTATARDMTPLHQFSGNLHGARLPAGAVGGVMVWIGGPRRDPRDRLGRGRRGLYLHDPPPGYHPPQPRVTLKDRQRIARQDWILEHVLAVILVLSAAAVILIICLIIATHH
jgi:hypothetical protein